MISIQELEALKTGKHQRNESLPHLLTVAGIKGSRTCKADMVEALYHFYKNEDNLINFWNRLHGLEKEILEQYVCSSGWLEWDEIKQIFAQYGQQLNYSTYYSWEGLTAIFPEYSPARIFFLGRSIPESLMNWLRKRIPPVPVTYDPVSDEAAADSDFIMAFGNTSHQQFVRMMRAVGQSKLKAAAASGLPTKAATVKFQEALHYIEPIVPGYGSITDIRTVEQTTLIYGMFKLLNSAALLSGRNGELTLGPNAESFLRMSAAVQTKLLLDAYLRSPQIAEWSRIPEIKAKTEYPGLLTEARQTILDHLAKCPPLVWLTTDELLRYVKKMSRNFLRKCVGEILTYDDYHRGYYSGYHNWDELEGRFIEVMLLEYLTVLGIVETAISGSEDEMGIPYFSVSHFRITKLGTYMLGMDETYETEAERASGHSGFVVQPNFDIIISEGNSKQLHQLFFDRFASLKADDATTIYTLDFASMVRAVNANITIPSIIDYVEQHSGYELPANVVSTMRDWANKSGKIRIRQVTIVETDDELLLQELLHSKPIRKYVTGELKRAFEIGASSASSVKREIEKKQYLCDYEKSAAPGTRD